MTCSVTDCLRPIRARGWCGTHYNRWRRDNPQLVRAYAPRGHYDAICGVDGCDRNAKGLGYCLKHYKAFRRHGTPTPRYRGVVIDGKRICAHCCRDMPAEAFRYSMCSDCWAEENRQRQHLRRAGGGERFTRADVLARDNFICQLCRGDIDVALSFPDPMSQSLDHIVPLARGGTHTWTNSQAAHLICNKRKWAHPMKAA